MVPYNTASYGAWCVVYLHPFTVKTKDISLKEAKNFLIRYLVSAWGNCVTECGVEVPSDVDLLSLSAEKCPLPSCIISKKKGVSFKCVYHSVLLNSTGRNLLLRVIESVWRMLLSPMHHFTYIIYNRNFQHCMHVSLPLFSHPSSFTRTLTLPC